MGARGLDSETGEARTSPSPVFMALGGAMRHARLRLLLNDAGNEFSATGQEKMSDTRPCLLRLIG